MVDASTGFRQQSKSNFQILKDATEGRRADDVAALVLTVLEDYNYLEKDKDPSGSINLMLYPPEPECAPEPSSSKDERLSDMYSAPHWPV